MEFPSSIWSKLLKFSDDQRCQRLQACQDITKCVQNCLERQREALSDLHNHKEGTTDMISTNKTEILDIESCVAGIRMMKYFHWRESEALNYSSSSISSSISSSSSSNDAPSSNSQDDDGLASDSSMNKDKDKDNTTHAGVPTCAREVHAQWACRAVALACSTHVIGLRDCFHEIGDKDIVLSVPYFGYTAAASSSSSSIKNNDPDAPMKRIPCREFQESLGKCVAERAAELEQRVSLRKQQEEA